MKTGDIKTCIHCEDTFLFVFEKGLTKEQGKHCPYCRAVVLGKPDDEWLPKIRLRREGGRESA